MALDLEDALVAKLKADAAIYALAKDRIYPAPLPDVATLPAITYQEITGVPQTTHDSIAGGNELINGMYQIDCWGIDKAGARALAAAVYAECYGWSGTVTDAGESCTFGPMLLQARRNNYDSPSRTFNIQLDFTVWYWEV